MILWHLYRFMQNSPLKCTHASQDTNDSFGDFNWKRWTHVSNYSIQFQKFVLVIVKFIMAHEATHTNTKITPESVSWLFKWSHGWVVQWDPAQGGLDATGHCGRTAMLEGLWHNLGMKFPRTAAGVRTSNPFPGLQLGFNWSSCCIAETPIHSSRTTVALCLSGWQSDVHGESDSRSNHTEEQKATIGATWASITPQQGHRLYRLLFFH